MNVCMFSRIMPIHSPGGMQDHVQTLSAGLVRKGHRVTVVTSGRADGKESDVVDGVRTLYLAHTPPGRNSDAYWFGAALKLEELQATDPFDILHSQSVGAYGIYKRGLAKKYHLPLVTSFHGTHLDVLTTSWHTDVSLDNPLGMVRFAAVSADLAFRYVARDLWFARAADVVIATSDADVDKYKALFRLDETRIRKVYNGIDAELFAPRDPGPLRAELGLEPGVKILLALARLEKDKGVQNAIQVMPAILARFPACLIVVGDGGYRPALERLASERGVTGSVRFVGAKPLAECARYFNLCDLFVDPTMRTDGYDLTIAEAMACQKPVIVSDVGANSTLIDAATGRDGVLIPRGDNEALAREIIRIFDEPDEACRMAANARDKIVSRFSIPAMVDGMERVYAELATARSPL